jgi:ribosomal protein S18 acetylase RimI-like enzyme
MPELRLRQMTETEFEAYRQRAVTEYAEENVAAGSWTAEGAQDRAADEFEQLLPAGVATDDMLLFMAEGPGGEVVGSVWLSLKTPRGGDEYAWIYAIEVAADHRGKGYGRALLTAAEAELRSRGVPAVGLNVFGPNVVAQRLYASAGYELTSQEMRKAL